MAAKPSASPGGSVGSPVPSSSGRPLPSSARRAAERLLDGPVPDGVRVHSGGDAAAPARSLGVGYLHHGSLDASPHDYFTRPLTDRDRYVEPILAPQAAAATAP